MKKKIVVVLLGMILATSSIGCGEKSVDEKNEQENGSSKENVVDENESEDVDFSITFNNVEYEFPMSYEEFVSLGWEYYDTENADPSQWGNGTAGLPADSSGGDLYYNNGDLKYINFIFYNPTDEFTTYDKCEIVGFSIDYEDDLSDIGGELNVPVGSFSMNGLVLGEATKEQISEKIGEGYGYMYTLGTSEEDTIDFNRNMSLFFDENNVFHGITYINIP